MKPSLRLWFLALAALVYPAVLTAQPSVLVDHLGSFAGNTPQFTASRLSQDFTDFPNSSLANIESFTAASYELRLTGIAVAMNSQNANGFSNIASYRLEIYSSQAAATASLTGNVYSLSVPVGAVTLTPFTHVPAQNDMLVSFAFDYTLATAGTYYIALIPVSSSAEGFYVYDSTLPGPGNSGQANPGAELLFPGNFLANGSNAAIRVTAIPEPTTYLAGVAAALSLACFRRRRA